MRLASTTTNEDLKEMPSLLEAQLKDPELRLVRMWVEKEEMPSWTEISGMSNQIKSYWSQFQRLCIHNEYLCRIWYKKQKPGKYQMLVPKHLRETVLEHCHDSII